MLLSHSYTLLCVYSITFFETTPFSILSTITSRGEEEELLVYTLASRIVSPKHAFILAQVKPPIT